MFRVKKVIKSWKGDKSPIVNEQEPEKDFYDYPVVKMHGADLFQRDVPDNESVDEAQD